MNKNWWRFVSINVHSLSQRTAVYKFLLSNALNREQMDIHFDEHPLVLDLMAENNRGAANIKGSISIRESKRQQRRGYAQSMGPRPNPP